ncbi:hypothetical protein [Deinococcus kurensis]|uniref:hypothetical protein n=1 Tax=Deinococcus kurensis TaxID=2662757 RepID=UPI0012D306B8|nr:hypothetical protein [Deinococcus kurensis]
MTMTTPTPDLAAALVHIAQNDTLTFMVNGLRAAPNPMPRVHAHPFAATLEGIAMTVAATLNPRDYDAASTLAKDLYAYFLSR